MKTTILNTILAALCLSPLSAFASPYLKCDVTLNDETAKSYSQEIQDGPKGTFANINLGLVDGHMISAKALGSGKGKQDEYVTFITVIKFGAEAVESIIVNGKKEVSFTKGVSIRTSEGEMSQKDFVVDCKIEM